MASIRHLSTNKTQLLEPNHVVGRGFTCNLRLNPMHVSAQHAVLRWVNERWELRDLGSSNGTFLNGERLKPGEQLAVREGARIAFGSLEDPWELADDSRPVAMAVPLDGGDPVLMDGELLVLPAPEDPVVTIYRAKPGAGAAVGGWQLEAPNQPVTPVVNLQVFECCQRSWRFCCTEDTSTHRPQYPTEIALRDAHLVFTVSRDEQRVHLKMHAGSRTVDLGARAHHYLLVTLARRRLEDQAEGHSEAVCGWVDLEDLAHDPRMGGPQLHIDVFRLRKQFASAKVVDAAGIIERRASRQLRIGAEKLTVIRE